MNTATTVENAPRNEQGLTAIVGASQSAALTLAAQLKLVNPENPGDTSFISLSPPEQVAALLAALASYDKDNGGTPEAAQAATQAAAQAAPTATQQDTNMTNPSLPGGVGVPGIPGTPGTAPPPGAGLPVSSVPGGAPAGPGIPGMPGAAAAPAAAPGGLMLPGMGGGAPAQAAPGMPGMPGAAAPTGTVPAQAQPAAGGVATETAVLKDILAAQERLAAALNAQTEALKRIAAAVEAQGSGKVDTAILLAILGICTGNDFGTVGPQLQAMLGNNGAQMEQFLGQLTGNAHRS